MFQKPSANALLQSLREIYEIGKLFQSKQSELEFIAVLVDRKRGRREARAVPAPTYQRALHTRSTVERNAGSVHGAGTQYSPTKGRNTLAQSLKFPRSYERLRSVSVSREKKGAASPTYRHDEDVGPTGGQDPGGFKGPVRSLSLPQQRSAMARYSRFVEPPRSPSGSVFGKNKAVRFQREVTVY